MVSTSQRARLGRRRTRIFSLGVKRFTVSPSDAPYVKSARVASVEGSVNVGAISPRANQGHSAIVSLRLDRPLLSVVKMPDTAQPVPARSETLRAFAGTDTRRRVREIPAHPPPLPEGEGRCVVR